MNSFIAFLVFIAFVAIKIFQSLSSDKEANEQEQDTPDQNNVPKPTIKGIFQEAESLEAESLEGESLEMEVKQTTKPTTQPIVRPIAQPTARVNTYSNAAKHAFSATKARAVSNKQGSVAHTSSKRKEVIPTPTQPDENNELQAIINDFTMEKAVIYSEILEPKFKEY